MKATIKTTANKSARTYTIRECDSNGKTFIKYRTFRMSKQEFESAYYWTTNDWKQYLKTDEYSVVR